MANNVNTNLTQRLFAYIQHRDDLTTAMTEVYKNSLIFVGDQRQIYVPLYNAYVGIGMDNYNAVVNRVSTVEQGLADLKQKSTVGVVTGAYVQRTADLPDGLDGNAITGNKLGGDILFTANGNYDENSGWAYEHNLVYMFNTGSKTGSWATTGGIQNNTNATSGIRLSYYVDYINDTVDGVPVSRPAGHRIVIDDTMTWSYMTKAYDYSLTFSRDYTNSRIDTLYHDLLGIGEPIMVPVNGKDIIVNNPDGTTSLMAGDIYEWTGTGEPKYNDLSDEHWIKLENTTGVDPTKTYYRKSTDYNNSYNMNIADGIQTLKEVAYMLDQLTDGGLGSITYITKTEWTNANLGSELTATKDGVTYYRVITPNGNPTTAEKAYAYYYALNTENLGIQMAYSIAGNTADINDLHEHVELAEAGKTTTRSMSYINVNNLATVSQWSHTELSVTDTNESLPNATYAGQSAYMLGDVISMVRLNLASTYLVYNHDYEANEGVYSNVNSLPEIGNNVINDAQRIGIFQKVNFENELPAFANNTYYNYDSTAHTMTLVTSAPQGWPTTAQGAVEWANKDNYYWIPGNNNGISDAAYNDANAKFEKLTVEYYNEHTGEAYYEKSGSKYVPTSDTVTAANATDYYRKVVKKDGETIIPDPEFKQHAIIDTANHIATTAWVSAFYQDNQSAITSQIENILEQAKDYTDEEIDKLDNNLQYSYAEFERWIAADPTRAISNTVGSTAYYTEVQTKFEQYVADVDALTNKYDSAYVKNVLRSKYISNIVETNGVVEITETNELPTDQLEITNTVWNSQQSKAQYNAVVLSDNLNGDDTSIENVVEQLFTYVYNNGGTPRQIYYHPATSTEYAYVQLTSGTDTAASTDYILNNDGTYSLLDTNNMADAANIIEAFNAPTAKSSYWRQVYRREVPYYEIKTSTISYVAGADNDTVSFIDLAGVEHSIVIANNTSNFYVKNGGTAKVEYLTGSVAHYDYSYVGGEGQNKVTLNVNITNVEDSTPTNRGFADSYDVKEYIENNFSWVNLSANVSQSAFETTAAFYNEYDIDVKVKNYNNVDADALAAAQEMVNKVYKDGGKLYYYDTNKYTAIDTKDTAYTHITKLQRTATGNVVNTGGVGGSDFYTISIDGEHKTTVYTTEQSVVVNPINMVATKVQ